MATSFPITATRQPRPSFFRSSRQRTLSSSSLSDYILAESDSSPSSSSSDDDDTKSTDWDDASSKGRSRSMSISPGGVGFRRRPTSSGPASSAALLHSPSRRQHLKLSLSLLRTRQALSTLARTAHAAPAPPNTYDALTASLKALAAALPADLAQLGAFLPILYRLAKDLAIEFGGTEGSAREKRRGLGKDEARRAVALMQRWAAPAPATEAKGKGRERDLGDASWIAEVTERVEKVAAPAFMARPHDLASSTLLNGLESLLLSSSLPRIGLSDLGLTSEYLDEWELLRQSPAVLAWYLSFELNAGGGDDLTKRATMLLSSVRSLDLSKNRLDSLPAYLPTLLPGLETISLTHNVFSHLPPCITLFASLRRLKTHGNRLSKSRRGVGTKSNTKDVVRNVRGKLNAGGAGRRDGQVETLVNTCAQVLRTHLGIPLAAAPPLPPTPVPPQRASHSSGDASSTSSTSSDEEEEADDTDEAASTTSTSTLDPRQTTAQALLVSLPPHLHDLLTQSYACESCGRFVPAGEGDWLPDLFERVIHLDPGVSLPSQVGGAAFRPAAGPGRYSPPATATSSRSSSLARDPLASMEPAGDAAARGSDARPSRSSSVSSTVSSSGRSTSSSYFPSPSSPSPSTSVGRMPSFGPTFSTHPSISESSSPSASPLGSAQPPPLPFLPRRASTPPLLHSAPRPAPVPIPVHSTAGQSPTTVSTSRLTPSATPPMPPPAPHLLTLDERILLALLGRGMDLTTFVVGPRRLCCHCAIPHLGIVGINEGSAGGDSERLAGSLGSDAGWAWRSDAGVEASQHGEPELCACPGCVEERRVRSGGGGMVLRWLRRKNGRAGLGEGS